MLDDIAIVEIPICHFKSICRVCPRKSSSDIGSIGSKVKTSSVLRNPSSERAFVHSDCIFGIARSRKSSSDDGLI